MIIELFDVFSISLILIVLLWGFERYRSRFVKTDLAISIGLAIGIGLLVFVPTVYDQLGTLFNIQRRVVFLTVATNVVLLFSVLYLLTKVRDTRSRLSELNRRLTLNQAPYSDGGSKEIAVLIPAYNEEDTIKTVIESLPEGVRGFEVEPIVISDGSADATAEQAQINGSLVLKHHLNQGQGGALITGFEIVKDRGSSIVVTMDADGQHPTDKLETLVSPIIDDDADFVIGSRFLGRDFSGNSFTRRIGIQVFTWIINVLTKSNVTDCTNGYRALRGRALNNLRLSEERFNAPELIIEAKKNGLRVQEVPITVNQRASGETKKPQIGYAIGLTRTIMTTWIR